MNLMLSRTFGNRHKHNEPPRAAHHRREILPTLSVAASAFYILSFNYVPNVLRLAVAGLVGVLVIASVFMAVSKASPTILVTRFALAIMIVTASTAYIAGLAPSPVSLFEYTGRTIRMLTGLAAIAFFVSSAKSISPRLLLIIYVLTLICAMATFVTEGTLVVAGITRPAAFTGGEDGIHSSAYTLTAALIGVLSLWRARHIKAPTALILCLPLLALIAAFQVRTTWTMLILFTFTLLFIQAWEVFGPKILTFFALVIVAVVAVVGLVIAETYQSTVDLVEFSSGRTAVYVERLQIYINKPLVEILLGTGPGSEIIESETWWWEAKNSHNDFIDILFQSGLLGLIGVIGVFLTAVRQVGLFYLPVLVALVASSPISNGLLGRPLIAILHLGVLAAAPPIGQKLSQFVRDPNRRARHLHGRLRIPHRVGLG